MPRINIDVDEAKYQEIRKIMEASGVSTYEEFFNNALSLTKWVIKQRKAGKAVGALSDDDHFTELDTPMLNRAFKTDIKL